MYEEIIPLDNHPEKRHKFLAHLLKDLETLEQMLQNVAFIYRFAIPENGQFSMEPNFVNFERIYKGELLAHLDERPAYSEWDARILMPLYQAQGDDGFFVIKEVQE